MVLFPAAHHLPANFRPCAPCLPPVTKHFLPNAPKSHCTLTVQFSLFDHIPAAYVVKDDIESGYANVIPLWHFGMTY